MIKTLIIEDETDAQHLLSSILQEYCPSVELVGIAANYETSLSLLKNSRPDVVFCDIDLEDCNAFEILESLEKVDFHLIFTTAYDEYALKAYDYEAIHYLLKPYAPKDVVMAMDRIKERNMDQFIIDKLSETATSFKDQLNDRIGIPTAEGIEMLDIRNITHVEAERSYASIYHGQQKIIASKPLKEIESLLPGNTFYRVHSSYLINVRHISRLVNDDGGSIVLSNGTIIPVARRRKKEISQLLLNRNQ